MYAILDVVLRVPPVFIIDTLLISGFNVSVTIFDHHMNGSSYHLPAVDPYEASKAAPNATTPTGQDKQFMNNDDLDLLSELGWASLTFHGWCLGNVVQQNANSRPLAGILAAAAMFMLSTKHLIAIYVWLASIGLIIWSYVANEQYVKYAVNLTKSADTTILYELYVLDVPNCGLLIGNYVLQVRCP